MSGVTFAMMLLHAYAGVVRKLCKPLFVLSDATAIAGKCDLATPGIQAMMRKHPWVLWVSSSRLRGEVVALAVTAYYLVHDQVSLRFEKCECEKLSQNSYCRCAPKFGMIRLEKYTGDRHTGNGLRGVDVVGA